MSDTYIPSLTENSHRVMGEPRACLTCGAIGIVEFDGARTPGWFVSCPNRNVTRGAVAADIGKCSNTRQRFRTTRAGAVGAWNVAQNPEPRRKYVAAEDASQPREFCRCGLSMPCNDCLEGTNGFQRKQSYSDASSRVRMG